jgi:hypothetical protein
MPYITSNLIKFLNVSLELGYFIPVMDEEEEILIRDELKRVCTEMMMRNYHYTIESRTAPSNPTHGHCMYNLHVTLKE